MKCLGSSSVGGIIVELTTSEWCAIGGKTYVSGYTTHPDTREVPDLRGLIDALRAIQKASPDLARLRATFQSFLMLTEPAEIEATLKRCGVAEPVIEPEDDVTVIEEQE